MMDNGNEDAGCKIPLRNMKKEIVAEAICSAIDYENLKKYSWNLSSHGYVIGSIKGKRIMMHQYVKSVLECINVPKLHVIDHLNNNRIDNRRCNLAVRTHQQNSRNVKKRPNSTSKYYGVSYSKSRKTYTAVIKLEKHIRIGSSTIEIDAAKLYDAYIIQNVENFKESGFRLNFPELENELRAYTFKEPRKPRSIYRHISFNGTNFTASVYHGGKNIYIGSGTELECAAKSDAYIVQHNLDKMLNFPDNYPNFKRKTVIKTLSEDIDEHTVRPSISNRPDIIVKLDRHKYNDVAHLRLSWHPRGYITWHHGGKMGALHRLVMGETDPLVYIDHQNGDRLDNRICNLRRVSPSQNAQNVKKLANTSSIYHGVILSNKRDRHGGKFYFAWVRHLQAFAYYRRFKDEEHAARARDLYIKKNIPNFFQKMNFEWSDADVETWSAILADRGIDVEPDATAKRLKTDDV